jgi:hypothetical protein
MQKFLLLTHQSINSCVQLSYQYQLIKLRTREILT